MTMSFSQLQVPTASADSADPWRMLARHLVDETGSGNPDAGEGGSAEVSELVFPSHVTGRNFHASPIQQDYIRPAGCCLAPSLVRGQ